MPTKLISTCSIRSAITYTPAGGKVQVSVGELHVGLALPDAVISDRLEASKGLGFNERKKFKFTMEKPEDLDAELRGLLQLAYEAN